MSPAKRRKKAGKRRTAGKKKAGKRRTAVRKKVAKKVKAVRRKLVARKGRKGVPVVKAPEALSIHLAGVGGQGVLLVSNIIGNACIKAGLNVLVSEVHGMAQRGGVVISTVRTGEVYSPMVASGEADVLLAFEPVEAARASEVVSKRTEVVINTAPIVPFTVGVWGHKYPKYEDVISGFEKLARKVVAINAEELASKAGSSVTLNIVMLGALMGRGVLPISVELMRETVCEKVPAKFREMNGKAFDLGYEATKGA